MKTQEAAVKDVFFCWTRSNCQGALFWEEKVLQQDGNAWLGQAVISVIIISMDR